MTDGLTITVLLVQVFSIAGTAGCGLGYRAEPKGERQMRSSVPVCLLRGVTLQHNTQLMTMLAHKQFTADGLNSGGWASCIYYVERVKNLLLTKCDTRVRLRRSDYPADACWDSSVLHKCTAASTRGDHDLLVNFKTVISLPIRLNEKESTAAMGKLPRWLLLSHLSCL